MQGFIARERYEGSSAQERSLWRCCPARSMRRSTFPERSTSRSSNHASRGLVVPLTVVIPKTWQHSDDGGNITDDAYGARLERPGGLVVELAEGLARDPSPQSAPPRAVGLAS